MSGLIGRLVGLHIGYWKFDRWYRWAWYAWPQALAILLAISILGDGLPRPGRGKWSKAADCSNASNPGCAATRTRRVAVAADHGLQVDFLASLAPDCSSIGFATVRVVEGPKHGKVMVENGTGFSSFSQSNLRYECNKRRTEGVILSYEPVSGYVGPDFFTIDVIYASGNSAKRHYSIEVK